MTDPNTSASGGYLSPLNALPTEDDSFDAQIQPVIVGITGIDGTLVRPRWQAVPPAQPARTVDWCAFGVTAESADTNPSILHDGADSGGLGSSTEFRSEEATILVSFYGPNARGYAALLRDGFGISQNREAMRAAGLAYVSTDRITTLSEIVNEETLRRVDVAFTVRRMVARTYAIENILTVQGTVIADRQDVTSPIAAGP